MDQTNKLAVAQAQLPAWRRRGKTRQGNRSLRRVWVPWAGAARKTPTLLGRTCRRLEARLGGKQAAVAVAQKILVILSHLLAEGPYSDEKRYAHLQAQQPTFKGYW